MGIQRARECLIAAADLMIAKDHSPASVSLFLAAAEEYGREKIHARNRRDAWKSRKRLNQPYPK
jgi:hypothetical protein